MDIESHDPIAAVGSIQAVLGALQHYRGSALVTRTCCYALSCICLAGEAPCAELIKLGGVAKLLRAVRLFGATDATILLSVCSVLSPGELFPTMTALAPSAACLAACVVADAALSHLPNPETSRLVDVRLQNFLISLSAGASGAAAYPPRVFPIVVEAVSLFTGSSEGDADPSDRTNTLKYAFSSLALLCEAVSTEEEVAGNLSVDPLLAVLREHGHNPDISLEVCTALRNISVYPGVAEVVKQRGGVALLMSALRLGDSLVFEQAGWALNNLAQAEGAEVEVGAGGAVVEAILEVAFRVRWTLRLRS